MITCSNRKYSDNNIRQQIIRGVHEQHNIAYAKEYIYIFFPLRSVTFLTQMQHHEHTTAGRANHESADNGLILRVASPIIQGYQVVMIYVRRYSKGYVDILTAPAAFPLHLKVWFLSLCWYFHSGALRWDVSTPVLHSHPFPISWTLRITQLGPCQLMSQMARVIEGYPRVCCYPSRGRRKEMVIDWRSQVHTERRRKTNKNMQKRSDIERHILTRIAC